MDRSSAVRDASPFRIVIDSNVKNTEYQIQHYCIPLQIVRQKPNVENNNEAL